MSVCCQNCYYVPAQITKHYLVEFPAVACAYLKIVMVTEGERQAKI